MSYPVLETMRSLAVTCLACAALAGCDPVGEDAIGPEGGTIVSEDGRLTIDIPAGALDEPVEFFIEEVDRLPEGALGPAYEILPAGTVFDAPVHVLYNYGAAGMDVAPQDIALVIERTEGWVPLADRHVFEQESIVSASALYLSTFCVVDQGE